MRMRLAKKRVVFFLAVALAGTAAVWYAARFAESEALSKLDAKAQERLLLYESTLHSALNRYRYLPFILALNPDVHAILEGGGDVRAMNEYLETVNTEAGPASIYIMNARGVTMATSNWRTPTSYMGHDYSFRPYFQEAMEGKQGVFYGVGVTTRLPGFFFASPIRKNDRIIGAAVVKVELDRLQRDWREGGETIFVTDQNGIIVLATRDEWIYRSLVSRDSESLSRIQTQEPYRTRKLALLPAAVAQRGGMREMALGPERFLMGSRPLDGLGWDIFHLESAELVDRQVSTAAGIGLAALTLLVLLGFLARERYLRHLSRQKAVEAKRIHLINQQLQDEVSQRRRKEQQLRQTQKELIHAGQMAALGQMAASVAHELNQPLAAIRMFSANCQVMLQRGQNQGVAENLETIHDLTGRLASVANQLKSFSRKSAGRQAPVDLRVSLGNALGLLGHQAESMGVVIEKEEPAEALLVKGNATHLDQVFVNLLQNALDAMRDRQERSIKVRLGGNNGFAVAVIQDSGTGLSHEAKERLFSPFFTTKEPGLGLGLGLSIIHGIIREMNGEIVGENLETGGACFTVRLPLQSHD